MTVQLAVALAAFFVEDKNFLALCCAVDFSNNLSSGNGRGAYGNGAIVVNQQYSFEFNLVAFLSVRENVYEQFLSFFDTELLSLNFNNCVHYNVFLELYRGGGTVACSESMPLPLVTCD